MQKNVLNLLKKSMDKIDLDFKLNFNIKNLM